MAGFSLFNTGSGTDAYDLSGALERQKANPGGGLTGNVPFQSRYHVDSSDATAGAAGAGAGAAASGTGGTTGATTGATRIAGQEIPSLISKLNPALGGGTSAKPAVKPSATNQPFQGYLMGGPSKTSTGVSDLMPGVRSVSMNPYDVAIRAEEAKRGGAIFKSDPTDILRFSKGEDETGQTGSYDIPQWLLDMAKPYANKVPFQPLVSGGPLGLGFTGMPGAVGDTTYRVGDKLFSSSHKTINENGNPDFQSTYFDPDSFVSYAYSPQFQQASKSGRWSLLNGTPYDVLDRTGKTLETKKFYGLEDEDNMDMIVAGLVGAGLGGMGLTAMNAGVGATGMSSYGGAAAGYGSTALPSSVTSGAAAVGGGAGAGAAGGFAGDSTAAGYGGLDAASTSTMGGGASVNGGNVLGSLGGATGVTEPVASAVGTGATTGSSGLTGGLSDLVTKLGGANLGTLKKAYTAYQLYNALTGGKGGGTTGSTMGNTNSNGFSMNDLFGLIGGGMDAYNQNKAADTMRQWLDSNQAKMEGFMNPNSPEYSALWERMSRKDAAAGRNSQYGPRTADFAAQVAQAKANNILNFTTGNSRAYSNALNQKASSFAGLNSALQNAFGHNNGGTNNLSSIIKLLSGMSGSGMSNEDFFNMIGDEGMPIDYGAGTADPTEEDVLDFMNRWGEL